MYNLPNLITFSRIFTIPFIVYFLYTPEKNSCLYGAMIFLFASITDWLDGYLARKRNEITNLGKFLDPLADKLLVTTALILLLSHHWIEVWIVLVIISREILVTGLRTIAAVHGAVVPASGLGKLKTFLQMFALFLLLLHFQYNVVDGIVTVDTHSIGYMILMAAVLLTIISGVDYILKLRKYLN